jgi:hypothetical protein
MNDFRKFYIKALGNHEEVKLKEALARAHEIRQFEIELYWKRATYFWAFQLVAFTVLGLLFKTQLVREGDQLNFSQPLLSAIPASIGVITGFAGYLSACGSKFWQENWEKHIDLLEEETKERLTQVIIGTQRPQFSVSRTNQFLLLVLTFVWGALLLCAAIPQTEKSLLDILKWIEVHSNNWLPRGTLIVIAVVLVCYWMKRSTRTKLTGLEYRFGDASWVEYPSKRKGIYFAIARIYTAVTKATSDSAPPFIIWRDPVGERRVPIPEASPPDACVKCHAPTDTIPPPFPSETTTKRG